MNSTTPNTFSKPSTGGYAVLGEVFKTCPICKISKSLSDYDHYFSKERKKYRPQSYCKACQPAENRKRSLDYFQKNNDKRLQYAKDYRANPDNKGKLKKLSRKFKKQYREELQDCYVRELLVTKNKVKKEHIQKLPEIVETKRLQIKIKRKLKNLKNAK